MQIDYLKLKTLKAVLITTFLAGNIIPHYSMAFDESEIEKLMSNAQYKNIIEKLNNKPEDTFDYFNTLAVSHELSGNLTDAEKNYNSALKTNENAETFINLIRCQIKMDQFAKAYNTSIEASKKYPNSVEISDLTTQLYRRLNGDYYKMYQNANLFFNSEKYTEVINLATQALGSFKNDYYFLLLRGVSNFNLGQLDLAEIDFLDIYSRRPYDLFVNQTLVAIKLANKNPSDVDKYISNLEKNNADTIEQHYQYSLLLIQKGNYEKAKIRILKALAIEPKRADFYELLALIELQQKNFPSAISNYKLVLAQKRFSPEIFLNLDTAYVANSQEEYGEQSVQNALKLYPNNSLLLSRAGFHRELKLDYENARIYYQQSLAINKYNEAAQDGLKRLALRNSSHLVVEHRKSHTSLTDETGLSPLINKLDTTFLNLNLSTPINNTFTVGIDYQTESYQKEKLKDINLKTAFIYLGLNFENFDATLSAGQTNSKNENTVSQPVDEITGNYGANANYNSGSNLMGFTYSKFTFINESNTSTEVDNLSLLNVVNDYNINNQWVARARYGAGKSRDLDFNILGAGAIYKFKYLAHTSMLLMFENVRSVNTKDYLQASLYIESSLKLTDKLESSIGLGTNYRNLDNVAQHNIKALFRHFTTSRLNFTAGFELGSQRGVITSDNYGYNLGLDYYF